MRIFSSDAIILRSLDYGEADRIVSFLTPDHGRLKGFARAARKSRKRFGPALEPFAQVTLHWSPPRSGDLVSLKEADLIALRTGLRQDLTAIALAGYGCELVEELLGELPGQPQVFEVLRAFLDHLAAQGRGPEARMLLELRLLALAGYDPHLLHCSACGDRLTGPRAVFAAERGGSLCLDCAGAAEGLSVGVLTLGTLARCLRSPPTLFAGVRFGEQTLGEGSALLAQALEPHLGRPLKSLQFLNEILCD